MTLEGNRLPGPSPDGSGRSVSRITYSHDMLAKQALGFINGNRDKPFFLYLSYTIPHANNEAGKEGMEVPSKEPYANENWPEPQKGHAAMITRMDRDVGNLLERLKELDLAKDTLVIFTSDNGPHREGGADPEFFNSNGPLRGIKRDLYEGGIRVPFIAWWPGTIQSGMIGNHVSAFWDFLPTACEIAGVDPPDAIDGISYLPELLQRKQKKHDFLYWEFKTKQAVRMGNWKAVRHHPDESIELYNIRSDIAEKHDVANEHPEILLKIEKVLKSAHTPSKTFPMPHD